MLLSIVMPVYNEKETIAEIIERVKKVDLGEVDKEIIIVDDFSSDGTREILAEQSSDLIRIFYHSKNMGKGAAVKTGLSEAKGDIILIQDADLEYDPNDYPSLIDPILKGKSKVVYGSRFRGNCQSMGFSHALGNRFLTAFANILYGTKLTDMETCYKVFTAEVNKFINLTSPRWGFDPEITAQILKNGFSILEVPISYCGREFSAGKKIKWKDAFVIIKVLIKYRFSSI